MNLITFPFCILSKAIKLLTLHEFQKIFSIFLPLPVHQATYPNTLFFVSMKYLLLINNGLRNKKRVIQKIIYDHRLCELKINIIFQQSINGTLTRFDSTARRVFKKVMIYYDKK